MNVKNIKETTVHFEKLTVPHLLSKIHCNFHTGTPTAMWHAVAQLFEAEGVAGSIPDGVIESFR